MVLRISLSFAYDELHDFCVTAIQSEETEDELFRSAHEYAFGDLPQDPLLHGTTIQYQCGENKAFRVDNVHVQAVNYTCQWDTNWDQDSILKECECGLKFCRIV